MKNYSAAHNNGNIKIGSPDPQTGLYNFIHGVFDLSDLNGGFGPSLPITFSFNALSTMDWRGNATSFGRGWHINLTSYNSAAKTLMLGDGTTYSVISSATNPWNLSHHVKDFIVENSDDGKYINIKHADGLVETLQLQSMTTGNGLLKNIKDPSGRVLYFLYDNNEELYKISSNNRQLVIFERLSPTLNTCTYFSGPDESNDKRVIRFYLNPNTGVVEKLSQPDNSEILFGYKVDDQTGMFLLESVALPSGTTETVEYNNRHIVPSLGDISSIPAISSFTTKRSSNPSEDLKTEFYYDRTPENTAPNNYWGYGADVNWAIPGDNLSNLNAPYLYKARTVCGDLVTEYTYNKFHQCISKIINRTNMTSDSLEFTYIYDVNDTLPLSQQSDKYELLVAEKLVLLSSDGKRKELNKEYEFDQWGNLLKFVDYNGITTINTYYPPEGDITFCPLHPYGLCAYLKDSAVYPAGSNHTVGSDCKRTVYTYQLADTNGVSERALNVVLASKSYGPNKETYTYQPSSANSNITGEIRTISQAIDGENNNNTSTIDYTFYDTYVMKTITTIAHDSSTMIEHQKLDRFTGMLLQEISPNGVKSTYEYDVLDRLTRAVDADGSKYENEISYKYEYLPNVEDKPSGVSTVGERVSVTQNGMTLQVYRDIFQNDFSTFHVEDGKYYKLTQNIYDNQGRVDTMEQWDYVVGSESHISYVKTGYRYGTWNEVLQEDYNDGTRLIRQVDPFTSSKTEWLEYAPDNVTQERLPAVNTVFDKFGNPIIQRILGITREVYSEATNTYDGWGRPVSHTTPLKNQMTVVNYDFLDRPLEMIDADGTHFNVQHNPWSESSCPINLLCVMGAGDDKKIVELVNQTYDGFNRLTGKVINGVAHSLEYDNLEVSDLPKKSINGRKQEIIYTLIPELNSFSNIAAETATNFNFTTKTSQSTQPPGLLLSATNSMSSYTNSYTPEGRLNTITQVVNGAQQKTTTIEAQTLSGQMLQARVSGRSGEFDTIRLSLDSFGRLHSTQHVYGGKTITETFERDVFGRISKIIVKEGEENRQETALTYDNYGHEYIRTIKSHITGHTTTITCIYDTESKLTQRETSITATTETEKLIENFSYDEKSRLTLYEIAPPFSDSLLPCDERGKKFKKLQYTFNGLDNLEQLVTTYANNDADTSVYIYTGQRLTSISHSLTYGDNAYPSLVEFDYDADGNLTTLGADDKRTLVYSSFNQLTDCGLVNYQYDAFNRLQQAGDTTHYYLANQIFSEVSGGNETIFASHGGIPIAEVKGNQVCWLGSDTSGTVRVTTTDGNSEVSSYSPYGAGEGRSRTGYNGERKDIATGGYMLGNGTRSYLPELAGFTSQDSLSPFDGAGINPYRYCLGDPINMIDPSGNMSLGAKIGLFIGNIALGIATAGMSVAAQIAIELTASAVVGGVSRAGSNRNGDSEGGNSAASVGINIAISVLGIGLGSKISGGSGGKRGGLASNQTNNGPQHTEVLFRSPKWYEENTSQSSKTRIVYGADMPINGTNVQIPLQKIGRRNSQSNVTIYSGAHGSRGGDNWTTNNSGTKIIRDPGLNERGFYKADVKAFKKYFSGRRKVKIIDMSHKGYSSKKFQSSLDKSGHHIMAFCYGRNDQVLLNTHNLQPVSTFKNRRR